MENFGLRISDFGFEESNKKKVDGEDAESGRRVKGKGEGSDLSPDISLFVLPFPLYPFSMVHFSGFSAVFHAKLRSHSFNQGGSK
jgi:hypothetical protein